MSGIFARRGNRLLTVDEGFARLLMTPFVFWDDAKIEKQMRRLSTHIPHLKPGSRGPVDEWHGGGDIEIHQYARALQNSAKTLVTKLNDDQKARTDWDACPVVLLYREALELRCIPGKSCPRNWRGESNW